MIQGDKDEAVESVRLSMQGELDAARADALAARADLAALRRQLEAAAAAHSAAPSLPKPDLLPVSSNPSPPFIKCQIW